MAITNYKAVDYKYRCIDIEIALAKHFDFRQNIIVPNISWGMNIHECDLLMLSKGGYATEIEIKVSIADLKKDLHKRHEHKSQMIKYLYFAIPEYLKDAIEYIPSKAGIITIGKYRYMQDDDCIDICNVIRGPEVNVRATKWDDTRKINLMRLSTMRIWSLKQKIVALNGKNRNTK